ncbi:MAG TPA: hypothetical protein VM753_01585 [Anaeromyxobacter sp.]|jgi:hypothetical protein|nr:hypothetical protein [Anaeromyxobacter sp.]
MAVRWVNVFLGAWVLVTGLIVGPHAPEFGNHIFLGLAIFLVAFVAMAVPGARAANVILGVCAIASPFVFGYASSPLAMHDIAIGVVVVWAASVPTKRRVDRRELADRRHLTV